MSEYPNRTELVFATLAGVAGVAGSYALAGYTGDFIVAVFTPIIRDLTPGPIVAFMIDDVGEQSHYLLIATALVVAVGLLAAVSLAGILLGRRLDRPFLGVGLAGVLAWAVPTLVVGTPLLAVGVAVPVMVFTAVGAMPMASTERDSSRRRFLASVSGALAFVGISVGLGQFTASQETVEADTQPVTDEVEQRLQMARDQSLDINGDVPGLVSSFEEFYNTDIAQFDPDLSAEDWSMTFTGEVGQEKTVTYEELTDMPTEHRFVTLRCVGEGLNGHKLDNAVWTGTPIKPLLEEVDPEGECGCVMLRAEDDYFVQFPVSALENGFLAWEMNGQPLPQSHGRPVRVLIPGHWGEVNVKWLSEVELLDEEMDGYWEQRGWHGTGPVNTVAKLWSDTMLENGNIEVAGHAYAGTRGIDRVEVSTDGGDSWTDAELSEPLPGEDVWRQWRYEFEPDGAHEVVVRAVDREGTVQPEDRADSFPSGATGWVSKTINAMDAA